MSFIMSDSASKQEAQSLLSATSLTNESKSSNDLFENTSVESKRNEIHGTENMASSTDVKEQFVETEPYYIFEESELPLERFNLSSTQPFVTLKELREAQSTCVSNNKSLSASKKKQESASREAPKPFASSRTKEQLLSQVDLSAIDKGVETCKAPSFETNWMEFARQLTAHCSTDLERVRAIYYWLGYFDFTKVDCDTNKFEQDSLMDIVSRSRQDKLFSALFHRLCICCGVPIQLITGYKKGTNYRIGHRLNNPEDEGMWFAVFVKDEWRFVDAHWGCCSSFGSDNGEWQKIDEKGRLDDVKKCDGEIVFNCNDYYFLTDPEWMIFKHFPFDPDWQLLAKPISLETFEELPFMFPNKMNDFGLNIVSHPKSVLQIPPCGEVELQFEESGPKQMYDTQLYLHNGSNRECLSRIELPDGQEMSLNRFQMVQRCGKQILIKVIPPKRGKYLLILKGSTLDERVVEAAEKDEIIHYVIHCPQSKMNVVPMPSQLGDAEWGMGARADILGVVPISHESGEVTLDNGEVEIRICADRNLDYQCELTSEAVVETDDNVNKVVHWPEDKGEHVFRVMAPDQGLYALSIMARERDNNYSRVGTFIVEADTAAEDILEYPLLDMQNSSIGWMDINGAIQSNEKPRSPHDKPHILCHEAELSITWTTEGNTFLTAQFRRLENGENNFNSNCDDRLFIDYSTPKKCAFQMKFPQLGNYILQIFRNSRDNSIPQLIFTYFIRALGHPAKDQQPFPKLNQNIWRQGFKLVKPKNAYLQPQSETQVIIIAPTKNSVKAMALLDQKQKVHLFEPQDGNRWELNFTTGYAGSSGGTLSVLIDQSNTSKKSPSYEKLVEFHLLGGAEQKDLELRKAHNDAAIEKKKSRDLFRKEKRKLYKRAKGNESENSDVDSKEQIEINECKDNCKPAKTLSKAEKAREMYKAKEHLLKALATNSKSKIVKRLNHYRSLINKENSLSVYTMEYLNMLDLKLNLQEAIQKARVERKNEHIVDAIQKIDAAKLAPEIFYFLENVIVEGQTLFKNIDRCERLYVRILKMDANTLLELRNYTNPTDDIKSVIQATLLILGHYEKRTRKWRRCQPLLKGILSSIRNFDHSNEKNHPGLAARAQELMKDVVAAEIALHSAAAAAFYNWSMAIIDLVRDNTKAEDFVPASMKLQRKILQISSEEEANLVWEDSGVKK